jgi:hypothetical protein
MSEVPMGGYGAPSPDPTESAAPKARDPRVLIGGGIGLAVVAVAGAYLFLGGGGSSSPTAAPKAPTAHHATPTPTATVIPVGKPVVAVHTFKGDVGRDPFAPLVTSAPPTSAAPTKAASTTLPASTTTPGAVVGVPGGVPGTLPTGQVTGLPTALPTAAPTTTAPVKVMVLLKAIAFHGQTPYVQVRYAGVTYALKTGDSAGESLKVLAIAPDDGTATFQLGDQTFDLHIGQSYVD